MSAEPLSTDDAMMSLDSATGAGASAVSRFTHEAMGTTFGIAIAGDDREYAQQAAAAAFEELDSIELELSRFIETSDVYRVSHSPAGQPQRVGLDFLACLDVANEVGVGTNGAFDATIGSLMACWLPPGAKRPSPSAGQLEDAKRRTGMSLIALDEDANSVAVTVDGVLLDFGGVGKGHALDRMAEILAEWDISAALLDSGQSSILATGAPRGNDAWRLGLRDPADQTSVLARVTLLDGSISGSGRHVHGAHIIDPRSSSPVEARPATWAVAPTAAASDALSTAFMVMSDGEVANYCAQHIGTGAILAAADGRTLVEFGSRDGFEIERSP